LCNIDVAELGDGQVVVEENNTGATEIEVVEGAKRLPSQTERLFMQPAEGIVVPVSKAT
jgi:hypothetical protein